MKKEHGFSLLELVGVLLLLLLLMLSGIQAWKTISREQQAESYTTRLNTLLLKARSEALLKQTPVYICAANLKANLDLQGCMALPQAVNGLNRWQEGVLLFQDRTGGREQIYDSKEALHLLPLGSEETRFWVSTTRFEISATGMLGQSQPVIFNITDGGDTCQQLVLSAPFFLQSEAC